MSNGTSTDGRTVLVTGAARGIGLAIARAFANAGDHVFAVDITAPPVTPEAGIVHLHADITDDAALDRVFGDVDERSGGVDVLVNNAGILRPVSFADVTRRDWADVMRVNLEAAFFVSQRVVRALRRRGAPGSIVNIASTSAMVAAQDQSVYEISKAGIAALTRALALELAPEGIRVNAVAPGLVATDLTKTLFGTEARLEARIREKVPLGRAGTPDDIAQVVVFLASPAADYIVGQMFVADGGWLLL